MSSLCALLGIHHPIIQAPMVGVSTPALAAAVSEAGGLGSLGLGASTPAQARELVAQTRARTARPFNLNLFCHAPARADVEREQAWLERLRPLFAEFGAAPPAALREIYLSFLADPAMLETLLELRPAVVSFHFGLPPAEWIERLRQVAIRTLACVTTPAEARLAEAAGVDALVAQASRPVATAGCLCRKRAMRRLAPWRWCACWRSSRACRSLPPAASWTVPASARPWPRRRRCSWARPSCCVPSRPPTPPTARR